MRYIKHTQVVIMRIAALLLGAASVAFATASCTREASLEPSVTEPSAKVDPTESALSLCFTTQDTAPDTKSVIASPGFDSQIRSIAVYVVASDGSWKKMYSTTGTADIEGKAFSVRADGATSYTVYALVNMGDPAFPTSSPESFVYTLPADFPSLGSTGLPMSGSASVTPADIHAGSTTSVTVTLNRLLAKVEVTVNKSNMVSDSSDGAALRSGRLKLSQVSRLLRPFAATQQRRAWTTSELYGSDTDWHDFTLTDGKSVVSSSVTLYVPENRQGTGHGTTQSGKTPISGRANLVTYLEYTATKDGSSDGVSGSMTYRCYLGENETNSFDIIGDHVYNATLNLTWNGLFFDGDWRVDNSDLSDGRRLYLSTTANTASTFTDWGHLRRNVASQLFVNFSRDGGATWVHAAKDIDSWPYGWDLYVDGVKQGSGYSGTATGDLGWAYTGDVSRDQLYITPGPSSVSSSTHTLQVKSADGRVASNVVSFEVSQPLELALPYGSSYYVAQRPVSTVTSNSLEDSGATITFAEKNGNPGIEIVQTSNTIVWMNLLAAGDYTVVATASNGQTGEVSFSVGNPVVEQLWTSTPLWVDGTESERMLRYKTTDGTEMTIAMNNFLGYGTQFAPSLYETLLKPRITSLSPVGSYSFSNALRNLIGLNTEENCMFVSTLESTTPGEEIAVRDYLMGQNFKVNVQAGVESLAYQTYFKNPFADVTNTSFNETFHDFTTMYTHMNSSQVNTYGATMTYSMGAPGKMLYADVSNILVQASETLESRRTALKGTYSNGSSYIAIGLGAEGHYHPSGVNDVYIHVQNKYDKAAGGGRAAYCLSKKIGKATIYLHVAWATIVKNSSYHGEYNIKVTNSGLYQRDHNDDRWDMRYLCGGLLGQNDVEWNNEVGKLLSSDFYTMKLSSNTGFLYNSGHYILTDKYGFVASRFTRNSEDVAYGLGFAIMKTFSGNNHDTFTWNEWRSSLYTSPFCSRNSAFENWTGGGNWSGLTGHYYVSDKSNNTLKDASGNGYVVVHFLQDLPVNPNYGYVE